MLLFRIQLHRFVRRIKGPGNQRLGLLKGSDPITYVTEWSCLSLLEEVERLLKEAIEEIEIHGHPW